MNDAFCLGKPTKQPARLGCKCALPTHEIGQKRRQIERCYQMKKTVFVPEQHSKLGAANARRVLQDGLEHGLQLAGRTADDTQDL